MITIYFYRNEKCYVAEFGLRISQAEKYSEINRNPTVNMLMKSMNMLYPTGVWRIQPYGSLRCRGRILDC